MIDSNININVIQQKAPSENVYSSARETNDSFSEHLDSSISEKQPPKKATHESKKTTKAAKAPKETKESKETPPLTDDEKLKIAMDTAEKLKGVVNDQSLMNIINSLLNAMNNGLDVSDPNQLVIPVKFSENEVGYLNNLLQQYGIGDKIQLVTSAIATVTTEIIPLQGLQGIITNPETVTAEVNNTVKNILENQDAKESDIIATISNKLTGTEKNIPQTNKTNKSNENELQANQNIQNNIISQVGTNLEKEGKITDIATLVKEMPASTSSGNIIPEDAIKSTKKGLSATVETASNSLDANTTISNQSAAVNNTNFDKQVMAQVKQIARPEGAVNVGDTNIINQVVKKASIQLRNGTNEIRLDLDPPSLGSMKIKLSVTGNHVKATIVAESSLIKDVIDSNLSQLKVSLSDQGLKVDQFSVLVGDNSNQGKGWNNMSEGFQGERDDNNKYSTDEIEGGILADNLTKINNYNKTLNPSGVDVFI